MTNDQMREAFEAYCKRDGLPPDLMEDEYEVWQAAYAAGMERARDAATDDVCKAFNDGFAAGEDAGFRKGMERAAGICDLNSEQWDTAANGTAAYAAGRCADTIRAEIKGAGHEG